MRRGGSIAGLDSSNKNLKPHYGAWSECTMTRVEHNVCKYTQHNVPSQGGGAIMVPATGDDKDIKMCRSITPSSQQAAHGSYGSCHAAVYTSKPAPGAMCDCRMTSIAVGSHITASHSSCCYSWLTVSCWVLTVMPAK